MLQPHMQIALLLAFASLAPAQDGPTPAELRQTRAAAERFLADWNAGRLADSYAAFTARLRQIVTPTQLEAALAPIRDALGRYVSIAEVRPSEGRIDDQRAIVLETNLRFERGATTAVFHFLSEREAWRLRFLKMDLPLDKRPPLDDAPVPRIAGELLAGIQRAGLASIVRLMPKEAVAQCGEQRVRDVYERMQDALGALRAHSVDPPAALPADCRQVAGRGTFEHGQAGLRLALCPDQGVWRLLAIDVQPVMTPVLFERLVRAHLAQALKRRDFELSCPRELVAVGEQAACRFTSGGRTRTVRARRLEEGDVEAVLEPE
jgi:hypothetical protein